MSTNEQMVIDFENDFTEDVEEKEVFKPRKEDNGKVILTEDTSLSLEDKIAKLYKLGVAVNFISEKYQVSHGKIYEILRNKGVELRKRFSKARSHERISQMSRSEKRRLIQDYKDGLPLEEIYKKYDINKHGCYSIIDKANVPRRQSVSNTKKDSEREREKTQAQTKSQNDVVKNQNQDQSQSKMNNVRELREVGDQLKDAVENNIKDANKFLRGFSKDTSMDVNIKFNSEFKVTNITLSMDF